MKYLLKLWLLLLFLGAGLEVSAQKNNIRDALRHYQSQQWDSARYFIDLAQANPETEGIANTWYYRGFIYKESFNNQQKDDKQSPYRKIAIESFLKFLALDDVGKFTESVQKSLQYLATSVYNDAATSLNESGDQRLAIETFEYYKTIMKQIEPDKNLTEVDIQFHLVLCQVYNKIYEKDHQANKAYFNKIRDAYAYILTLDVDNLSANYNLGILYYNEAVHRIKALDYDLDLVTLSEIQAECAEIFLEALPYMKKAYELNPSRTETLIGLSGIYFSLNELELSQKYSEEAEGLKKKEEDR